MPELTIIIEPNYRFGSSDNCHVYPLELNLAAPHAPLSILGVLVDGIPAAVFGAISGPSAAHASLWLSLNERTFLMIGDHIVCFGTSPFSLHWAKRMDTATCFGVYYNRERHTLIAHGELEISRFDENGNVLWSSGGADVFSGEMTLCADAVHVTDFNGKEYRFDYENGKEL